MKVIDDSWYNWIMMENMLNQLIVVAAIIADNRPRPRRPTERVITQLSALNSFFLESEENEWRTVVDEVHESETLQDFLYEQNRFAAADESTMRGMC